MALVICATWSRTTASYCAQFAATARRARAPSAAPRGAAARRVRVLARKRPLFAHEQAKGEFDCVSVPTAGRVVVHHAVMHADLRRMFLAHHDFGGNAIEAFGEADATSAVCERGVGPLIEHVQQGGCSTVFMYGQTGSGKTYTMRGIEEAASLLMPAQPDALAGLLSVVEIAGARVFDLLHADKPEVRPQPTPPRAPWHRTLAPRPCARLAHPCHPACRAAASPWPPLRRADAGAAAAGRLGQVLHARRRERAAALRRRLPRRGRAGS